MEENEDIKLHKPHTVEPLSLSSCRMWDSETKPDCHPCSRDIYAYTYFESRWFYSFSAIMKCVIKSKKPFKMVHRYQLSSSWARSTSIKNPSKHYLARSQRATMKKTSICVVQTFEERDLLFLSSSHHRSFVKQIQQKSNRLLSVDTSPRLSLAGPKASKIQIIIQQLRSNIKYLWDSNPLNRFLHSRLVRWAQLVLSCTLLDIFFLHENITEKKTSETIPVFCCCN